MTAWRVKLLSVPRHSLIIDPLSAAASTITSYDRNCLCSAAASSSSSAAAAATAVHLS